MRSLNACLLYTSSVHNFRITDDHLGEGGAKTKYAFNIAAIQTLKQIEAEGRQAMPQEQEIPVSYTHLDVYKRQALLRARHAEPSEPTEEVSIEDDDHNESETA